MFSKFISNVFSSVLYDIAELYLSRKKFYFTNIIELFQELRLDGNSLTRIPTEALSGPDALQNLHLQDNTISK